jgi:VIT1/CCC1 family predicted Fe2+/Mn2+ transporter
MGAPVGKVGEVMRARHLERHVAASRIGWLRAAVLGANDGVVSTASLIVGVAAAGAARGDIVIAGAAALVAGAMSMAAGEYVSVSSQSDAERADLARERRELQEQPELELAELTQIYVGRGLDADLAGEVARQLMTKDALGAHARDELHIIDATVARPVQAAWTSAVTFAAGAIVPLLVVLATPASALTPAVVIAALVCLAALGALGASAGGAPVIKGVLRVTLWGALALAVTAAVGRLFSVAA